MGNWRIRRSANNLLGLLLLPLILVSLFTGVWIFASAALGGGVSMGVIFFHAYGGLLSAPIVFAKLYSGLSSWRGRSTGSPRSGTQNLLTLGLVLCTVSLYGSGLLMYANLTPGGNALYKQVHLYSTGLAVPLVSYHLYLYLPRAAETVRRGLSAGLTPAARLTRGGFLWLGLLAILGWGAFRGTGRLAQSAASEDPNDFPVTLTSGGSDTPDPETWELLVTGSVEEPLTFSFRDLQQAKLDRSTYSLDCVIGWSVVREWGGVPVGDLLRLTRPRGEVLSAIFRSTTGYEVVLTPDSLDDPRTMVTLEVEGVPLSPEHGFPARLMAPDVIGEKCVKWLAEIEVVSR